MLGVLESIRVPLLCLDALLGSLTPSMANNSLPMRPLPLADGEHGAEHGGDVIAEAADEMRDGGEVRLAVAAQRNEGRVAGHRHAR